MVSKESNRNFRDPGKLTNFPRKIVQNGLTHCFYICLWIFRHMEG
jgi:hypothetical protein